MFKQELPEDAQAAIHRILETAPATVEQVFERLVRGELTLERAAEELELEAIKWANKLHNGILHEWALQGIPPDQFESIARDKAEEIAEYAAEHFAVACQPIAGSPNTPLVVGQHPAVIEGATAPEIVNRGRLKERLLDQLLNYPRQYRRDNLFRYRASLGPATPNSNAAGQIADTPNQEFGIAKRLPATIKSPLAARRMEEYLQAKHIGQTEFANQVGTTDRTLRRFRKTGTVRRDIFDGIAREMATTREGLLKPD